jgi:acyl-CoA thioesterase I
VDKTIVSFMRNRLINRLVIFLLVASSYCLIALADSVSNDNTVLVIGDSLSAGFGMEAEDTWVALLEKKLRKEGYVYKVVNASISGDTTGNGRRRMTRALQIHQPDIVIIELGGNDGLRGLPISKMQENLTTMITQAQQIDALVILAGMQIPPNYGEDYANELAAVYPALAEKYAVPLIAFFLKNVALNPALMQADGIHPNEKAQPILLENVWQTLKPALPTNITG